MDRSQETFNTPLEIAEKNIKEMLKLERDYRCEVSDPELRLKRLCELWEHGRFMSEWSDIVVLSRVVRDMIEYQIMQINHMIIIQKEQGVPYGVSDQQLKVLNAIFEIICTLVRSSQRMVMEKVGMDELFVEYFYKKEDK